MPDAGSLVTDEARSLIGEALAAPLTSTITAKEAQRFALAAGDLNPVYFDEEAAQAAGYETTIVPPTFLGWALTPPGSAGNTRTDGLYRAEGRRVNLRVKRVMFGGEEWDFVQPVYPGDTVTAVTRLKDLEEKMGSSGPFVLQTTETTYTNQRGETVARSRGKSIAR
ncbi:MAG: MaoC family dehydratase N-terminal domain-containing protein [Dehalococcoidia bacterium]|nr:MaoC family dehydratase N-terminal domain-containing protein [Dehalococcoidia bacterium]